MSGDSSAVSSTPLDAFWRLQKEWPPEVWAAITDDDHDEEEQKQHITISHHDHSSGSTHPPIKRRMKKNPLFLYEGLNKEAILRELRAEEDLKKLELTSKQYLKLAAHIVEALEQFRVASTTVTSTLPMTTIAQQPSGASPPPSFGVPSHSSAKGNSAPRSSIPPVRREPSPIRSPIASKHSSSFLPVGSELNTGTRSGSYSPPRGRSPPHRRHGGGNSPARRTKGDASSSTSGGGGGGSYQVWFPPQAVGARVPPFRSTGWPSCQHPCCMEKLFEYQQQQQQQLQHQQRSDCGGGVFPAGRTSTSSWLGPTGVSSIIYTLSDPTRISSSSTAVHHHHYQQHHYQGSSSSSHYSQSHLGGAQRSRSQGGSSSGSRTTLHQNQQHQHQQLSRPAGSQQSRARSSSSRGGGFPNGNASRSVNSSISNSNSRGGVTQGTPIWFLLGWDVTRRKWNVCSGTMGDSWNTDQGCAIIAGQRELQEEFKLSLEQEEVFELLKFHFYAKTNCSLVLNLDRLPAGDFRRDIRNLQSRIDKALRQPQTKHCQREVTQLGWFSAVVGEELRSNANFSHVTSYGTDFCQRVCDTLLCGGGSTADDDGNSNQ